MHFTTLFILEGRKLGEDISYGRIEETFSEKYCYCCGETETEIMDWCDWFLIGGRWNDAEVIKATKGIRGENGIGEGYTDKGYSIANIEDITEINEDLIYSVATEDELFVKEENEEAFNELIRKVRNKEIKGVVALIDCHD